MRLCLVALAATGGRGGRGWVGASSSVPPLYTSPFTSKPVHDDLLHFVDICESSISCAGVSLEPNGTVAGGSGLYRHSFVGPFRTSVTYETRKKDYTYHRGEIFVSETRDEVIEERDDVTVDEAKERCSSLRECVAFTYPVWSLTALTRPPKVTFVSEVRRFIPSKFDRFRTYVNNDRSRVEGRIRNPNELRYQSTIARNPYRTCCDRTDLPAMSEVAKVDTLERISCDISREEFFFKYELPRKPVMLVGCEKDWPAAKEQKWLPKNLAPRFSNHTRWRARMGGEDIPKDEDYNHNVRWGDIAEAMLTGKPYYLFDQLYDSEAKVIDDEYDDPLPVRGGDLYRTLPYFDGPLRWFNVGPALTGTMSHMDPYATDAWNTLLKGHKWWIIYPEGFTDESQLECDPGCSVDSPITLHWYASIGINAARSEYIVSSSPEGGYGQHVLQKAGETIYVPDGLIHSVYNYDEVIAITRNYASAANLDRVWEATVKTGDPVKWRTLYYRVLNREQRKRVRKSEFWPPNQWEDDDVEPCEVDEDEDIMTAFPMRQYDNEWVPEVGELVEAMEEEKDEDGDEISYWFPARVVEVKDGLADLVEVLGDEPNEVKEFNFRSIRSLPKEGDLVEAQYRGRYNEWYRATVIKVHMNATWDVKYVDGDHDAGLGRYSIREFYPFEHGEMVQMLSREDGEEYWVDSVITGITTERGTVDVRHFDGEEFEDVPPKFFRRVRWEFLDDDDVVLTEAEEKGRVVNVRNNGRYDIFLDNGEDANCTSWTDLTFPWAWEDGFDEEESADDDDDNDDDGENEEEEEEEED